VSARASLERGLSLPPAPSSAGQARRFVRQLLEDAQHDEWTDAATLVVSELVTNSVLHGHSAIELVGRVTHDHVRLEVRDTNPALPSACSYDDHATTGRGLALIAAVSQAHGVDSLGDAGKVVWCCIGSGTDAPEQGEVPGEWDASAELTASGTAATADAETHEVVLRDLPATLWLAAREHHDALLRELALLLRPGDAADGSALDGVALGDVDLAAADDARTSISTAVDAEVDRARRAGQARVPLPEYHPGALPPVPETMDLRVPVHHDRGSAFARLQDVLDEGERLAHADRLLVRPGLPEIVAVRDWACEQVIAQLAGAPPARWPGTDQERFTSSVDIRDLLPSGWDVTRVTHAQRAARSRLTMPTASSP
jgi:anti-sigma regulatory factor (Ser/Thr protein kinase)